MAKDFIPQSEGQLIIWLGTFKTNIAVHGAALGYTPLEITDIVALCTDLIAAINAVETAKAAFKTAVETKDNLKFDNLGTLRAEIKKMKTNADYTTSIGESLGVIGTATDIDPETITSVLTAEAHPGYIRIKFTKKGLDGVNIYTRLKGQTGWLFLARDTNSPYDDQRPLAVAGVAETREYMAIGVIADEEVGQQSDIVSVVYGG